MIFGYPEIIKLVQDNLTPDLLVGRWVKQEHPLEGHCYIGAEALYHLIDKENYDVYYAVYNDEGGRATHWWLQNKNTGEILDPTKEQYTHFDLKPPYMLKRRGMFLTKQPSARAKIVVDKVNEHINNFGEKQFTTTQLSLF
jgi:hypothetical protein